MNYTFSELDIAIATVILLLNVSLFLGVLYILKRIKVVNDIIKEKEQLQKLVKKLELI